MSEGYKKHKRKHHHEPRVAPVTPSAPDIVTTPKPISQSTPNGHIELSLVPQLPVQSLQEEDDITNYKKKLPNDAVTKIANRNGSGPVSGHRPSPDFNVSLPVE